MSTLFWFSATVAVGLIGLVLALYALMGRNHGEVEMGEDEVESEDAAMAPLQKRAWWGLGIGTAISVVIVGVLVLKGPDSYNENTGVRLVIFGLLMGGAMAYLFTLLLTIRSSQGEEVVMDERDQKILERAPHAQVVAMLLALAVWSIVLTEVYRDAGQIPIVFPMIIFWSCFLINILALPIGILLGYSRR